MPTRRIELAHLPSRPLAERGVEVGQGLVEQQHPWLRGQRASQRHPLLLPTRELADPAPLEPGEVDQLQGARHAAPQLVAAGAADSSPNATFSPASRWGKSA